MDPAFKRLRNRTSAALGSAAGFVGLGVGLKEVAGKSTSVLAWRVYVSCKEPRRRLSRGAAVPPVLFGLPTDVVERAITSPCAGEAIANSRGVPGTLGCLGWQRSTGERVLLSNYHVLFGKQAQRGDPIWKIGVAGPDSHALIGRNARGKAATVRYRGEPFFIDAAIGTLTAHRVSRVEPACASTPVDVALGGSVWKRGGSTGRTEGIVVDVNYPDRWYWEYASVDAPNQILVQPTSAGAFSDAGDSGAVLRDDHGRAVGLLWGSNARGEGVACHLGPVVRELEIRIDGALDGATDLEIGCNPEEGSRE